ncbi:hypothetical protein SAMN05660776_0527 [Salegentibacter holothuriorum]|uniref:Uncharacterized protein n=1 Tax=Salegentibacter holothuriorum TaxID=241145 RepID=A0A1T5AFU0_9FLAO|nr:hypothetical protein [Salegentibacter holothuriorum]SKB33882.1 hypothetical protein SAMN05660776_0527 [Salegentibacter holothuriorum]
MKLLKDKLFIKGLVYDALGMVTMAIPLVGPFLDLLWAPYAARKMGEMYPGKKGKVASVLVFIEEILPGTDIIPTFTLMYFYTFVWGKNKQENNRVIDVEIID